MHLVASYRHIYVKTLRADKVQQERNHRLGFAQVLVEPQLGQCLRAPLALTPPSFAPPLSYPIFIFYQKHNALLSCGFFFSASDYFIRLRRTMLIATSGSCQSVATWVCRGASSKAPIGA